MRRGMVEIVSLGIEVRIKGCKRCDVNLSSQKGRNRTIIEIASHLGFRLTN